MAQLKIFTIKDGDVIIHREIILTIPSFKKILTRDKDRFKKKAFKEFCYIYHRADHHSLPNRAGYTKEEAHTYAVDKSGLDKGFRPDIQVNIAIKDYRDEQGSAGRDAIVELLKTFRYYKVAITKVRNTLQSILDKDKLSYDEAVNVLNLIKLSIVEGKEIPILIRDLRKAVTELEVDEGAHDVDLIRGTESTVPMSADPAQDY